MLLILVLLGSGTKRNRGLKNHVCNVPFARYRKNDVIRTLYFPKNLWESGSKSDNTQPLTMSEVKLSDAQKKAAQDAFSQLDKRGEEKIRVGDIQNAMKKLGHNISGDWLESMEDEIDAEGTGYINLDEFCEIVRKKMQADEDERELKEIFRVLDKEKKGEVNTSELRWILKNLGDDLTEDDIDDMIADVDTDGSGWVDYEEFAKLMLGD